MTDKLEETAQQIADHGREALIARLRPAFEEAAAAHSDVLNLTPDQLDAMVERAVDRADGLQWRRALASVATEQLGITLGEALGHPAVARAQELAGAPSYEQSLAQLGPLPGISAVPPETGAEAPGESAAEDAPATAEDLTAPAEDAPAADENAPADEDASAADEDASAAAEDLPAAAVEEDAVGADEEQAEAAGEPELGEGPDVAPEPEPVEEPDAVEEPGPAPAPAPRLPLAELEADEEIEPARPLPESEPEADPIEDEHEELAISPDQTELPLSTAEYETVAPYEDETDYGELDDALRVAVIHLGGIANLAPAERDIELQMSEDGLDIVRGGGEILGRLDWDQVKALEVPTPKGRRRMRRGASTHLIVRTARGDASFEVPEVSPPELQQHLAPIVARHVRGS